MKESDELLDLVNEDDQVIGSVVRHEAMLLAPNGKNYIRGVAVLIMNNKNQLWVPILSLHKAITPGGYDNSAEGHLANRRDV